MFGVTKKRVPLAICASIGFLIALALALFLLFSAKLSGAEFTAFVLSFAVLFVAVGFAPEIQEISIAGNVLKLKEVKAEAVRTIESLKEFRVETLRIMMELALKTAGGFASEAPIDPRIKGFMRLIAFAKDYNCAPQLKEEVVRGVEVLLQGQLIVIWMRNKTVSHSNLLSPIELAPMALNLDAIEETSLRGSPGKEIEVIINEIKTSLEEYSRLYHLRSEFSEIN